MTIAKVDVNVVDVGQGQCTFVEIYDTTGKLTNTLLFDCGTDKASDQTDANLNYIAGKIYGMDSPTIDRIIFSHSDNDHISLTRPLLNKLEKLYKPSNAKPKFKVKQVVYGGNQSDYTKAGRNILETLVNDGYCVQGNVSGLNSNYTQYNSAQKEFTKSIWESPDANHDVKVHVLVANTESARPNINAASGPPPAKKSRTSEVLNRVSIVCALFYKEICYVICGDATNRTMAWANLFLSPSGQLPEVFQDNTMTTLPHHGSRKTGLTVSKNQNASDSNIEIIETFAKILQSDTISISSYELHEHPSLELINRFKPPLTAPLIRDPRLQQDNAHRIQCYYDQDLIITAPLVTLTENLSYTFDTQSNIFGTRYSGDDPYLTYNFGSDSAQSASGVNTPQPINSHASWKYTTQANGDTTLVGVPDLQSTKFTESPTTTVL
ncbi:MAG: hypothetical protein AAGG75_13495, partial [Bacteroidota bacterium]